MNITKTLETIDLSNKQSMMSYSKTAGTKGESYVSGIKFIIPEEYLQCSAFVDIENPSGEKYRNEILGINRETHELVYEFSANDLSQSGRLYLDLIFAYSEIIDGNEITQVCKPFRGEFAVKRAICASDAPNNEQTTIVTSELTESVAYLLSTYTVYQEKFDNFLKHFTKSEDGYLEFEGEEYATSQKLKKAIDDATIAYVDGEKLIFTTGGERTNG